MTRIKGKKDGPGGRNEHYDIGSRKDVPRRNVVAEIKRGEHPGAHVVALSDQRGKQSRGLISAMNEPQIEGAAA